LVDGEFAPRKQILSGLTLEQVRHRPAPQSHSIYEELWHANRWQNIVVLRDEDLYAQWQKGNVYPPQPPASEEEWSALVAEFLDGIEKALRWTDSPEKLRQETDPGVTMADVLHSLAVHSTYHLGKIVAIRQLIRAWPTGTG
jgi:hypothetical protein